MTTRILALATLAVVLAGAVALLRGTDAPEVTPPGPSSSVEPTPSPTPTPTPTPASESTPAT